LSAPHDASKRLQRLAEILARWTTVSGAKREASGDSVQFHLTSVPLERIRELTLELQPRTDIDIDEVDAVTMRVLLNDYAAAVTHLRAVASAADERLATASAGIGESREFLRRQQELAVKRAARFAGNSENQ